MSTKGNKDLVRQFYKARNEAAGDTSKVRSVAEKYDAPGFIGHSLSRGDMNLEQTIQYLVMAVSAFPDLNVDIDDILAEGDKVVTRYTLKGTHKGTFMGIPATGKQIVTKAVEIDKIVKGKIVERWDFSDNLGMMTQLGAIPSTAPKT